MTVNVEQLVRWFNSVRGKSSFWTKCVQGSVNALGLEALNKKIRSPAEEREKELDKLQDRCSIHSYNDWKSPRNVVDAVREFSPRYGDLEVTVNYHVCRGKVSMPPGERQYAVATETYARMREVVITKYDEQILKLVEVRDKLERRMVFQLMRLEFIFKTGATESDVGKIMEVIQICGIDLGRIGVPEEEPVLRVVTDAA